MRDEDIQRFKCQIEEEQKAIRDTQQKVLCLLSDFFIKEPVVQSLDSNNQMKISLSNKSVIGSLFKEDDANRDMFLEMERNKRKERLASERRAEYNAFLEKKERELQEKRKIPEEKRSITPKSILESIDYDRVLARMREEESRFRNLNCAEPNVEVHTVKTPIPTPKRVESPVEKAIKPPTEPVKSLPKNHHFRTGGGGDPVKDSFGNVITARGFKDISTGVMGFPSFTQESPVNKDSYREELKRQIEEKKRLEALEKQQAQLLEEQIARRIEQQRLQMQIEYQNELTKNNRRNEQLQQERLRKLEEFQRQDAALRNQRFKENVKPKTPIESPHADNKRSTSPPVPAVRSKVILQRSISPAVSTAKALNEVKPENLFSSLAEIRRTIMKDQHNSKKDKDSYEVTNWRTVPNVLDDYEDEIK